MAFPESFLDELVARNDIADVVSGYVQLNKRSGSNLFGLCPFHSEKTASFSVAQDKQIYHCFGCGKGGGVINFIMEIENLSFPDAVRFLAKRAGMTVPEDDVPEETRNRRARMLELNREAARFFYGNLKDPMGKAGVEYIQRRGISREMVKRFGLGVAFDTWNALSDAMLKKGYSVGEMLDAGLVKKGKNGGVYDTFRNRLMFPVIDVRGSVIGFSGRILGDGEPKYLNSSDTLVFSKSRNLFALNLAKKSKADMLILAEGNVDVVALHQAGFDCAVASLGTSLTPDQARLMSRYTQNVVIAYDSDGAGVKAAQRAIGILEPTGMNVKVLRMDGAKDPDEFIQKKGADAFKILLEQSENHIEYQLLALKQKHDLESDEGRVKFLMEATGLLANLSNAVEREIYGVRAAEYVGVSPEAVHAEVRRAIRKKIAGQKKKQERQDMRPALTMQPKDRSVKYENVQSAAAEEGVLQLLMQDLALFEKTGDLAAKDFSSPFLGKTYGLLRSRYEAGQGASISVLAQFLAPAEIAQLTEIMNRPWKAASAGQAMADYIEKIKTEKLKKAAKNEETLKAVWDKYKEKKGYGG